MKSTRSVSLLYFFAFLSFACQGRFLSLFFRDLGLQNQEIGFVISAGSLVGLVAVPAWTAICDLTSVSQRTVLMINILGACVAVALFLLPSAMAWIPIFFWTLFSKCLFSFFLAPVNTILDTIAVHKLENPKRDYGRCRLWGAVSWGICNAFILGPFIDILGTWIMVPGFLMSAVLLLATVLGLMPDDKAGTTNGRPQSDKQDGKYAQFDLENAQDTQDNVKKGRDSEEPRPDPASVTPRGEASRSVEPDIAELRELRELRGIQRGPPKSASSFARVQSTVWEIVWAEQAQSAMFFVTMFVVGIGTTLVEGLVFLFWTEELGASNFLCGLSVLVTVSLEIPLFHYSETLLTVFNHHTLIVLGGLSYVLRVVCYTLFADPWWILAVEPLHGVTFAFVQLGAVHYAATLAPEGLETSTQGLATTARSIGSISGTFVGGIVMQHFGSIVLYRLPHPAWFCLVF